MGALLHGKTLLVTMKFHKEINADKPVAYRAASRIDAPVISEILNENILLGNVTLWERTFSTEEIAGILEGFSAREKAYLLLRENQVIGWGWIRKYHEKEGYAFTCETSVFLRPSFVNRGFGSPFKRFILEQCRVLGYHHVHAKIMASNSISIAYNLKLGYTVVGTQKEIGYRNGKWIDVVIMQKLL